MEYTKQAEAVWSRVDVAAIQRWPLACILIMWVKKYFLNFNVMYFFCTVSKHIEHTQHDILQKWYLCGLRTWLKYNHVTFQFYVIAFFQLLIFFAVIVSYGMLSPVDRKLKAIYLLYGDEIGRRAGHPEYMMPTSLTRVIHKDSSHSSTIDNFWRTWWLSRTHRSRKTIWGSPASAIFWRVRLFSKQETGDLTLQQGMLKISVIVLV